MIILILILLFLYCLYYIPHLKEIEDRKNIKKDIRIFKLKEIYNFIIDCAEKSNTKPFLIYGTLLGKIRNNDLICYDYDLDFGIINKEYMVLVNSILKNNKNYKIEYYNNYFIKYIKIIDKSGISADISSFTIYKNLMKRDVPLFYSKFMLNECTGYYDINNILPLKQERFINRTTYIPQNTDYLLKCYYGSNYMIPDHKCNNDCTICKKKFN